MKRKPTSKSPAISKEKIAAALAAAPDHVDDPECPYDPNDAEAVAAFWSKSQEKQ